MRFRSNAVYSRMNRFENVEVSDQASVKGVFTKSMILVLVTILAAFASIYVLGAVLSLTVVLPCLIGEFIFMLLCIFIPSACRVLSIPYAICEGFLIGTVGSLLEIVLPGVGLSVVLLAGVMTLGIFLSSLIIYTSTNMRISGSFRLKFFFGMVMFVLSIFVLSIISLFVPIIKDYFLFSLIIDAIYVLISVVYCFIQIDDAKRIVEQGVDKKYEWYGAIGILLAIIWLFWDILDLILRFVIASKKD